VNARKACSVIWPNLTRKSPNSPSLNEFTEREHQ
jgi:hypothetical protein